MEAEDNMMSKGKIVEVFGEYDSGRETVLDFTKRVADLQAEITAPIFFKEGKKAGKREVVEWLKRNFADFMPQHNDIGRMGEHWQKWHNKLKEWGVV